jgi:hypothetical protein
MPAGTALSNLPLQLETFAPTIADAVESEGIFAKEIGSGSDGGAVRASLRSFRAQLLYAYASAPTFIGLDTGTMPSGVANQYNQFLLSPVSWCLPVQYSQLMQLTGEGKDISVTNPVTQTLAKIVTECTRTRDIFLQTPGDGSLGSIDSFTGANFINLRSATTTVIDGRAAHLMQEQQPVQVMSPGYVLRGTCNIINVYKGLGVTQQIQVDQVPAGSVAGDLVIAAGLPAGAPQGINGIPVFVNTNTLGNLYGLARSLPYVFANGVNLSNTAQVTKPVFVIAENQIMQRLGMQALNDDYFWHTHLAQVQSLDELAFNDQLLPLAGGTVAKYDPFIKTKSINGRRIMINPHADYTRWDFLRKKSWNHIKWGPGMFWFKNRGGQMVFQMTDPSTGTPTAMELMYYVVAEQTWIDNPISQGGVTQAKVPQGN